MVTLFMILGVAHMLKLNFTLFQFTDSWREYSLLCVAGFAFGWLLLDSLWEYCAAYILDLGRGIILRPQAGWLAAAALFIIVLHQVRYFLNDGPPNIAMAAGVAAAAFAVPARLARGIELPESFSMLIESNRMNDEFSAGIIAALYRLDPFSPNLFGILGMVHRRRGNFFKAELAAAAARLLALESGNK